MGASVDWIVDLDATLDQAQALAERVKEWLIAREVISTTLCPQQAYSGADLMARGASAAQWDACPLTPPFLMSGLEVAIERTVYHTGDNGIAAIRCPGCAAAYDPDDLPWSDAVGAWFSDEAECSMACPACHTSRSIVDWTFDMPWGFGNLAFGFWNWPISEQLVNELSVLTGHRCRLVHEHI
ncbi:MULTISPECIES: hypothetical protein [unclassified Janthinobacterium]|uniref:hypothetical protein n=1 Tax=unclassified Janthinobacterium TaxID=2610881 RepID=UPI00035EBBEC|nr:MULTISPECIES: hypothetical protein [unclassified Janthinobacterium]